MALIVSLPVPIFFGNGFEQRLDFVVDGEVGTRHSCLVQLGRQQKKQAQSLAQNRDATRPLVST